MTIRARMSLAFALAALLPLGVLAHGVRREVSRRVTAQYERRVSALVDIVRQDLAREAATISARLEILGQDLSSDDRFRQGAVLGDVVHRRHVLDWAGRAMDIAGLSMLRVYDDEDRIVSSGHFRNEFGRADPGLPARIRSTSESNTLIRVKTATGSFTALASTHAIRVGGRRFTLVGGTTVDESLFARLGRDGELDVSLVLGEPPARSSTVLEALPLILVGDSATPPQQTHLAIAPLGSELRSLRADLDRWIVGAFLVAGMMGAVLVMWLATALSRPLATLARAALSIDFTTPDVDVVAERDDEVGTLARRFSAMTRRLRTSAVRLRDAERRATVGEMARQVNHDVKNGLVPIRNVLRHLSHVQETSPHDLATVFGERRATLDSSVAYLDELATRWARLAPRAERKPVDVTTIARDAAMAASDAYATPVRLEAGTGLPPVFGDPIALRRILDNLLTNAVHSLDGGAVTMTTTSHDDVVRIVIADTGRGMTPDELSRALAGFYTTRPHGTGLGLSVVRRLVSDHGGSLHIDTAPHRGTTVTVELPAHLAITRLAGSARS